MALDNETRNYVDTKFEKTLNITKERIEDCPTGKILDEKVKQSDRRLNEMNGEIVHLAEQTTQAVDSIREAAQATKIENEKEKGNKRFQIILSLFSFIGILIIGFFNIKG